jgi:hypothetical protein
MFALRLRSHENSEALSEREAAVSLIQRPAASRRSRLSLMSGAATRHR